MAKNYNLSLAFFVTLMFSSSFSFYLSLSNHIPATLAFIFGFLAFDGLFQKKILKSLFLLTLCFYTHIGVSWFLAFSLFLYGLFNKEYKKGSLIILISTFILSLPILLKQIIGIKYLLVFGWQMPERYILQIKIVDYLLAVYGIILVSQIDDKKYRFFLSLFLASFIFLVYPYRFFSNEGFLAIIFLSALSLQRLYETFKDKKYMKFLSVFVVFFILFFSPTISMNRSNYKICLFDSAFMGMLLAKGETIWFPEEYLSASALIKENTDTDDIIYSTLNIVGIVLASISERPTANALLPEIGTPKKFDPVSVSKIIVFCQDDNSYTVNRIVNTYNLTKIGENKIFILYKNPSSHTKVNIKRATISFQAISFIGFVFISTFFGLTHFINSGRKRFYLILYI
jgi:hypothetical protein